MQINKLGVLNGVMTLAVVFAVTTGPRAAEETYHFGVSEQRTNITFQSETDFETILGSSRTLRGTAVTDLDAGRIEASFEVPVDSMLTGIKKRDDHLRSGMWLNAKKYPTISFVSKGAKKVSENTWEVSGEFTMHGVSKEITTTVDVRQVPAELAKKAGMEKGKWVKITAPFKVKLSDFGVKIPKMAAAKVNDVWEVRVQAFASTVAG